MTRTSAKVKILVVDDNPENIWPLIEHLENEYEILYATDGEKALDIAFSDDRPDLILLDIMMSGMDGYEVCSRLKADDYTSEIPVIFLTAKTEERDETKGLELGAQDYITKPFSLPVVRARIKSVLNLKREMERRLLLKTQLEQLNSQLESQVQQKMREFNEARETLQAYEGKYSYLFQKRLVEKKVKSILVVDDNPENIHILVEALEAEYEVMYATNGQKALDITFSENRPDLILLDVMMPGMDGYEVCSRLKASAETWDIPVIFVTALGQEMDETKGLQLGAVDFVTKPFSLPVIEARIKAALRLKEEMDNRMVLTRKLEDLNKNLEQRVKEKTAELEQAHEDLKVSEKKYRTIYENAIEGIFQSTPEGRFISASPALARILGYDSPQELISTVTDIAHLICLHPEDMEEFTRILQPKGELFDYEMQLEKKDGEVIWVMVCAKAVRNEMGDLAYFQGFLTDITERKRAEEKIREALQLAEEARDEIDAIVKSVPHGLIVTDMEQRIVLMNPAAEALLGLSLAELGQRSIVAAIKEPALLDHLAATLAGERYLPPIDLELYDRTREEVRTIQARTSLAKAREGGRGGIIIVLLDVTREREVVRMKNEFISTAAHELNTPLTSIMGYAELLKTNGGYAPEEQREFIATIYEKGEALSRIVEELLQISRMESGRPLPLAKAPCDIQETLREVVAQHRVENPGHRFELALSEEKIELGADRVKIVQVVENLLSNAVKYSRGGGPVRVTGVAEEDRYRVTVEDAGIGMTPEQVARVFERFYRADTSNTAVGGLGLGMSIAKGIVEAHGGEIRVESEPGRGTKVTFTIPLKIDNP